MFALLLLLKSVIVYVLVWSVELGTLFSGAGELVETTQVPWRGSGGAAEGPLWSPGGAAEEPWRGSGGAVEEQRRSSAASSSVDFSPRSTVQTGRPDTNGVHHVTVHCVPSVDVLCSYYSLRSLQALKYQRPASTRPGVIDTIFNFFLIQLQTCSVSRAPS